MSVGGSALADVGVGICGPGAIGDCHARAIAAVGGRVVAVAGPKADDTAGFAAAHGIGRTYAALDDLLGDSAVAAVVVSSPSPQHAGQTIAALRAGKHVLSEIPVATSLADAEAVAAEAAATGLVAMVAHTLRFWGPHRRVRDEVEDGTLRPRHVVGHTLMLRQRDESWTGKARDWRDSVLWHQGGHLVDAALWFLDATDVAVSGRGGPPWSGTGTTMDVGAVLTTADGALATLALSYHSRLALNDFVVIADDRTLHVRDGRLYGGATVVVDGGEADAAQDAAIAAQDAELLGAIVDGRPPAVTVADVLPAMRVLDRLAKEEPT